MYALKLPYQEKEKASVMPLRINYKVFGLWSWANRKIDDKGVIASEEEVERRVAEIEKEMQ